LPSQPLELFAKIKVPFSESIVWFPDSRRLAIWSGHRGNGQSPFWSKAIIVVDIIAKTVSPPVLDGSWMDRSLAVSPDGSIIAVHGPGLRLFSTETWRELAQVKTKETANCWHSDRLGMAFTPDSRFIWVGCASLGIRGAIKLTVPALAIADTVEIAGKLSQTSQIEFHDVHVGRAPLALHVVTSVHSGSGPPQAFVRVIDLTTKADLLPTTPLSRDEAPLFGPSSSYVSSDGRYLLVYRGQFESGSIVAFDISSRARVALFAPLSEIGTADPAMQPDNGHWGLSNLIPIPNGRVIAALASRNWDGGVIVWDYRSGQRIQRIYGPGMAHIALAPDGTRVAGGFLDEIYVYSIGAAHEP
jgi:WD40 repeat protein